MGTIGSPGARIVAFRPDEQSSRRLKRFRASGQQAAPTTAATALGSNRIE